MRNFKVISEKIITWYRSNKRDLPWRNTSDPYHIWLSEVILQQTRVGQGLSYYNRFIEVFPNIQSLANADEQEVLKLWQGLGYYSRARNMHCAARDIVQNYHGKFPGAYQDILKLKGIGSYTAAAIASFAFNLPHPVIDGNVIRVISRVFGLLSAVDTPNGMKRIKKHTEEVFDADQHNIHNQAIMEFGALVCKPVPLCTSCVLQAVCNAFKMDKVQEVPLKSKGIRVKNRYFHYFILRSGNKMVMQKRTNLDIWKNLFEFPMVEVTDKTVLPEFPVFMNKSSGNAITFRLKKKSDWDLQILTHQKIHARFWLFEAADSGSIAQNDWLFMNETDVSKLPVPKLIERHIHDC